MPQVKEFCVVNRCSFSDGLALDKFVDCFINIERIYLDNTSFDMKYAILPFIHRSTKLQEIYMKLFMDDRTYCNEGVINLSALNRERKKCDGASKITIYVDEKFYLKTKEALMRTSFDLIELKRAESIVWDIEFDI